MCPTWVRMRITLAMQKEHFTEAKEHKLKEGIAVAAGVRQSVRVTVESVQETSSRAHTDVTVRVRVPADELSSKRASIRDALLTQEAANTVSQAVGVSVDVPEAPYIDGPLSRSVSSLICEPGLQCGDAGCPKCVCDCSC